MPSNILLSEDEEARLEDGGGVSIDTKRRRYKASVDFCKYVSESCSQSIDELLEGGDEEKQ